MNKSFWNKVAGAKGKTLACVAIAALSAVLLFVVCGDKGTDTPNKPDCTVNPYAEGCVPPVVDVCASGPTAACCNERPSFEGCGGTPPNPCASGPTTECCAAQPSYSGCNQVQPTGNYCRWDNDPSNCYGIGGPYDDIKTEAECRATSGEVVTNCGAVSQLQYCYWGPGECYPISDPSAPCTAPCDAGLTQLQNCQTNGFVSNSPTCSDAPTTEYYCQWATGCYRIANPNAVDPNATGGLTYLENCQANGKVVDKTTCDNWTPPAVQEFCNWGTCVGGSGWNCTSGGCYRLGADPVADCTAKSGTIVSECPAGTKPPSADY